MKRALLLCLQVLGGCHDVRVGHIVLVAVREHQRNVSMNVIDGGILMHQELLRCSRKIHRVLDDSATRSGTEAKKIIMRKEIEEKKKKRETEHSK